MNLAAQRLERMASLSILVSAGILLAAIGFAQPRLIAGALFYLVSSTLALSALFLLAELIERSRSANEIPLDDEVEALPRLASTERVVVELQVAVKRATECRFGGRLNIPCPSRKLVLVSGLVGGVLVANR